MTDRQILEGVRTVMRERVGVTVPVGPQTDVLRDLKLDSIQLLTLVVELENHFQICFDPGDEQGISTVESVVRLIGERLEREEAA
jgi:acyl carrier protein